MDTGAGGGGGKEVDQVAGGSEQPQQRMKIGWPTEVRHVAHVTFDRFGGFLGLPADLEPDVPRPTPSVRSPLLSSPLSLPARRRVVHYPGSASFCCGEGDYYRFGEFRDRNKPSLATMLCLFVSAFRDRVFIAVYFSAHPKYFAG
jgi:hypothetical protein